MDVMRCDTLLDKTIELCTKDMLEFYVPLDEVAFGFVMRHPPRPQRLSR
jgi:hypothetical protein